jgi:hypothetical protein
MRQIAFSMLAAGVGLFATGCGRGGDHREVKHDMQQLVHDAQVDATHAANASAHELQADVNHAAVELRADVRAADHRHPELIQVRGDVEPHLATPAQFDRDAKADAVQAAGAAAEAEAEKLLKLK